MIKITQVPPGVATGATYLVEADETICKPFCVDSSVQPTANITFTQGTVTLNDGIAIVPITAKIEFISPSACGCAHTQLFTEKFNLPFTAGTTNVVTLTPSATTTMVGTNVRCCKARGIRVTTVLEVAIA